MSVIFLLYLLFIDDIKNFDFDLCMLVIIFLVDLVGVIILGSVYDKSVILWEIVVYGESGINDSELIIEVNLKLGSFLLNVRFYLVFKGNIIFSNFISLLFYNLIIGKLVIEGVIIIFGSMFNINISGVGIEFIYKRVGSIIESSIILILNYIFLLRLYLSSSV